MLHIKKILLLTTMAFFLAGSSVLPAGEAARILFLGDRGPHHPFERFQQLSPVLKKTGIVLSYTEDMNQLQADILNKYDGLLIFANIEKIEPAQEKALLEFVAAGKGFIPLHCASFCFLNSDKYVELCGAQFHKHATGIFRTEIVEPEHPVMRGYQGFRSWDETYVHHRHNKKNRTVLEYRVQDGQFEPWTWVRTHGKGRVFYTAWGHDERTWSNPGFHNLVERGIRWAIRQNPQQAGPFADRLEMTKLTDKLKPFEYIDVGPQIPNYTPGKKWGAQGKTLNMMQKPISAQESQKHYVTPANFELQLFVSEPDLKGKPIAMTWDERGRLWVCETYDYPNELQPLGKGRDRIRICEDTNHDGRADKFTVFAEKLSIPTSIAFWQGGAIVQNGMETLYLKDTNGDDVADVRKELFGGWALGDTHGGVSNFQYGLDNWIYAMQGYNNSNPTINGKPQQSFRMGFFRFRPDGSQIEFLRSTNNNTWGLGISEEGLVFGSTANGNPSEYMPIPNRYYERVKGWAPKRLEGIADTYLFKPITNKIRQVDVHGGYTAAAGHSIYTARHYPKYFWNRTAFVCGPTGHLVGTFLLNPDATDFHSTSPMNLVASDDEWAAPIMAEVGPDANVWIIDWYNYIVQHNPTPQGFKTGKGSAYESELRDKTHGRIYRLVYKGRPSEKPLDLSTATPKQLIKTLTHSNMFWRKHAQRLLVERGNLDVVPGLINLVNDRSTDAIGLNVGAIHALWTLQGLGALSDENDAFQSVTQALSHPSAGVRRNAILALSGNESFNEILIVSEIFTDSNSQVKLAGILALADGLPNKSAGIVIAEMCKTPEFTTDRWYRDAVISAAGTHAYAFLAALVKNDLRKETLRVVEIIAEHIARNKPESNQLNELILSLEQAKPQLTQAVLVGMNRGWSKTHAVELNPKAETVLVRWFKVLPTNSRGELIKIANSWGSKRLQAYSEQIISSLLSLVGDHNISIPKRVEAAKQLVNFQPDDLQIVIEILEEITPQTDLEFARGLLGSLEAASAPGTGKAIAEHAVSMTPSAKLTAIRVLLSRPQMTKEFLLAVQNNNITISDLSLEQKQSLASHPDKTIREQAKKLLASKGGLPSPDRQKVLKELLHLTKQKGDHVQGKAVFKKHCMKCHRHSGEGEAIGPDLTGMAVHTKHELLTHIIDPSKDVEGNFRIYTVVTEDGRIYNGLLTGESKTTIELFDAEAKKHTILREEIDELVSSRKSLMPEGFEKQATDKEIVDLLEFMTHKGKYIPIPLAKAATIISTQGMFWEKNGETERMIFPDWSPKTFDGIPFHLVDPQDNRVANTILLNGPHGKIAPTMPRRVVVECNTAAKAIHLLSGVSGWGFPVGEKGTVSMIVRLHYTGGVTEDHELKNGIHFADYIRRVDVPKSKYAFKLRNQQIRYLAIFPQKKELIQQIEFIKGSDQSAPIVMSLTVETR